jgi:hypothetical protein
VVNNGRFLVVVLASISDVSADINQGSKIYHLAQEAVVLVFTLIYWAGLLHTDMSAITHKDDTNIIMGIFLIF